MDDGEGMEELAAIEPSEDMINSWRHAIVTAQFDGKDTQPREIAKLLNKTVHMLTAWNPGAIERDMTLNAKATEELKIALVTLGVPFFPGVGRDDASSWEEHGFAIVGLTRSEIKELGTRFGQVAVYEYSPTGTQKIVWCVGSAVIDI